MKITRVDAFRYLEVFIIKAKTEKAGLLLQKLFTEKRGIEVYKDDGIQINSYSSLALKAGCNKRS